ncbi:hypothetical protein SUDANB32_00660 [Streptomyces sp. enrichment culture]
MSRRRRDGRSRRQPDGTGPALIVPVTGAGNARVPHPSQAGDAVTRAEGRVPRRVGAPGGVRVTARDTCLPSDTDEFGDAGVSVTQPRQ